ncbi:MAG: hypothetical protein JNK49_17925 [Planctomycetes bacterium]|nr:hypothetical protein [Planctomycetota bacterium]
MTRTTLPMPLADLRETLFGDLPLATYGVGQTGAPWMHFAAAAKSLECGDPAAAIAALQSVLAMVGLESRHALQAWDALRQLGVKPAANVGKRVLGVVLDVPVETGLDTLAAYADGTARYLNHAGSAIVWEAPDDRLAAAIQNVVAEGQRIATAIGPWQGARPALPAGMTRLSMLTPSGLHFGQAPFDVLAREPMAAPLIGAGTQLMQALIGLASKS